MSTLRTITCLLVLAGCGSTAESTSVDEAFRRIQVHEATIAHASAAAEACAPDATCEAELELCDAVERLCEVSRSIEDPDATRRCEAARRRCPEAP
ncbi:MAG: hypothetical protein H6719_01230 [Sandaracinaceae bacterium]|nr:hypothetical protein [Sandaracinaceae bacterium]